MKGIVRTAGKLKNKPCTSFITMPLPHRGFLHLAFLLSYLHCNNPTLINHQAPRSCWSPQLVINNPINRYPRTCANMYGPSENHLLSDTEELSQSKELFLKQRTFMLLSMEKKHCWFFIVVFDRNIEYQICSSFIKPEWHRMETGHSAHRLRVAHQIIIHSLLR